MDRGTHPEELRKRHAQRRDLRDDLLKKLPRYRRVLPRAQGTATLGMVAQVFRGLEGWLMANARILDAQGLIDLDARLEAFPGASAERATAGQLALVLRDVTTGEAPADVHALIDDLASGESTVRRFVRIRNLWFHPDRDRPIITFSPSARDLYDLVKALDGLEVLLRAEDVGHSS
jgi:hypothetical protein